MHPNVAAMFIISFYDGTESRNKISNAIVNVIASARNCFISWLIFREYDVIGIKSTQCTYIFWDSFDEISYLSIAIEQMQIKKHVSNRGYIYLRGNCHGASDKMFAAY